MSFSADQQQANQGSKEVVSTQCHQSLIIQMSIYSRVQLQGLKKEGQKIMKIAVSNVPANPTVAVTTSNNIYLFNDAGQKHQHELNRSITPTCIQWHSVQPILAIGWQNGKVTLYNQQVRSWKEQSRPHENPIVMIRFNADGSRMVTSDMIGLVVVWRGINILSCYSKDSAVYHCIFCNIKFDNLKSSGGMFLFGCMSGRVCLADDLNHCNDVCKVGGSVKALMFYQKQNSVIIITSNLLLVQFRLSANQQVAPDKKAKFSIAGQPQNLSSIWIGSCLLATCSNQNMIRLWHVQADQNYILSIFDVIENEESGNFAADKISAITYDKRGRSLIAGTRYGRVLFWKNTILNNDSPLQKQNWSSQPSLTLGKPIQSILVGKNNGLVVCKQNDGEVVIVSETKVMAKVSGQLRVITKASGIQISSVDFPEKSVSQVCDGVVKGIDLKNDLILFWTSKKLQVVRAFVRQSIMIQKKASLSLRVSGCGIVNNELIAVVNDTGYSLINFQGEAKSKMKFLDSEGRVVGFNISNKSMLFWTSNSYIKFIDTTTKDFKTILTKKFEDSKGSLGIVRSCQANSDSTKIAVLNDKDGSIQRGFYILDVQTASFQYYDLGNDKIPIQIFWDQNDKRYLGLQTEFTRKDWTRKEKQSEESQSIGRDLMTFFVTTEAGIKLQQNYVLDKHIESVFAISIPFIESICKQNNQGKVQFVCNKIVMHDYEGLDLNDHLTKNAILNFSFYLSTGNLDEAYKSVKTIQNPFIWQKMAEMCVKTKRLDVAEICFGNMRFARGARAIRQAKAEPDLTSRLAMVAIQLDMPQYAAELYQSGKRYDLLNKMYMAQGNIDKAIQVSKKLNRISLKHSFYQAAKFNEAAGSKQHLIKAVQYFEKAGVAIKQVPRMMVENGMLQQLQEYVNRNKSKQLFIWYGQLKESQGNIDAAISYYRNAPSTQNIVRILLSTGDIARAVNQCRGSPEPKASFMIANSYEKQGNTIQAIRFYGSAQYYSQAMRLAINQNLQDQILSLTNDAPNEVRSRAATYFLKKGKTEKAIRLFRLAKNYKKALQLAIKNNLTQIARQISKEIDQEDGNLDLSPQNMKESINRLIEQGKGEKVLPLLMASKQYEQALQVCMRFNLDLSDELVNHVLQNQGENKQLLKKLAEKSKSQGNFQLASKLYLRLGQKVKSIKCLVDLGNTQKIISFANTARSPQIFILAANFLQGQDWQKDGQLVKTITMFYSKAKAFDHLSMFFQSCSLIQIDQHREYSKALSALKQALKHATTANLHDKIASIQQKISHIQKFLQLQNLFESNPKGMIDGCDKLLDVHNINDSVRVGDILSLEIQYYYELKDYQQCYALMRKMQQRKTSIKQYVEQQIIQVVTKAVGKKAAPRRQQADQEEVIEEDIRK